MSQYTQSTLLATVAKALPNGHDLPNFRFRGSEWEADSRTALGYGATIEEALHAYLENAKTNCEQDYGNGSLWNPALAVMEAYAPPLDLDLVTPPNHQPEDWSGLT